MVIAAQTTSLRAVTPDNETVFDMDILQGTWSEAQYLKMTDNSGRLLEYSEGAIEVLAVPTDRHQMILGFLYVALYSFIRPLGGVVLFSAMRMRISADKFREPDLMLFLDARDPRRQNKYWLGADLVVEVVSPDDPERDIVLKRSEYAAAGIPEYWIINPIDQTVMVLMLEANHYADHGTFRRGELASSRLLADFRIAVTELLDAA